MQRMGANHDVLKCITGIIMRQMSAKAGIKKHIQVPIDASLFKEFAQLHDLEVFLAQDATTLTTCLRSKERCAPSALKKRSDAAKSKVGQWPTDGHSKSSRSRRRHTPRPY
jgi:hypothetical protein